ncbi:MAG: AAA family ATPase [Deltaproteobacteria bacterium]|nr:AAA family ATPase [Deltaproteobacteria bacterium]
MYLAHFQLDREPFSLTPDPRFLFLGERHREALAHLLYGLQTNGGFVQLTGEVGTGKTTLCRSVLEQVPAGVDVALVLNPRLTAPELVATVCDELRVDYPAGAESLKVLVDALNRHLLASHAHGRRTVLIVDEAQQLSADVLEQVRLLTNLETSSAKLLQIVLIGQPELQTVMARPELRQLAQRITARYHLGPLTSDGVVAYVRHRLEVAGRVSPLFTTAALRRLHRLSGGVPRLINVICERALLGAYGKGADRIGAVLVARAAAEVRGEGPRGRRWVPAVASALLLTSVLAAGGWWVSGRDVRPASKPAVEGLAEARAPVPAPPAVAIGGPAFLHALPDSDTAGYRDLFARWGLRYDDLAGGTPCERAEAAGLGCLEGVGSWKTLAHLDLPAAVELSVGGAVRRAVVAGLAGNRATLVQGDRAVVLPRGELEASWTGRYTVLWRPPPFGERVLQLGSGGPPVAWLRDQLGRLEPGVPPIQSQSQSARETFDAGLRDRVEAFQRRHGVRPDGKVGVQTVIQLSRAAGDPEIPSLGRGP